VIIAAGGTSVVVTAMPVPATTAWGLVLVALSLAGIGTFAIRRSRS
jgi:hypothetical protein